MIDLIYSQDVGQRHDVIITDTRSYSDIVFTLITLLGLDYRRSSPTSPTPSSGAWTQAPTTGR